VGDEPEATAIVTAVVHLARALHLTTVAEGVETAAQRSQLQFLGCEQAQGYHWSRPVSADQLDAWLTYAPKANADNRPDEPYSVLVVDDDEHQRELVTRILHTSGRFTVIGQAADGQAGIDAVRQHHPDLVLLDLAMPNVSGLEALPQILRTAPDTKVVLLSGTGTSDGSVPEGVSAFVRKNVQPPDLLEEMLIVMGAATTAA
jgi:CheY-like chemotaxis protein